MRRLGFVALAFAGACGPTPIEAVERAVQAAVDGELETLRKNLDPAYADAMGDRPALLARVKAWQARFPDRTVELGGAELVWPEATRRRAQVELAGLELSLDDGHAGLKRVGPAHFEVVRDGSYRVASGLFTTVFDIDERLEAARVAVEANRVDGLRAALHPLFRQGPDDADRFLEQLRTWIGDRPCRVERTGTRIEVRSGLVHADAYLNLSVDGGEPYPAVLRATFQSSAGRWLATGVVLSNTSERSAAPNRSSP